jgi:hypothetical protein
LLLSRVAFLSGIVARHSAKFPVEFPLDQTSFPLAFNKRDQPTPFGQKSAITGQGEWTGAEASVFSSEDKAAGARI